MNWGKVKELLKNVPDDYEVVISSDSEGNEFNLFEDFCIGIYTMDGDTLEPDFDIEEYEDGAKCVVLWPAD